MTRIGDKIQMKQGIEATVKYIGPIDNKDGQWIGLELSKEIGKNNGIINGKKYYECKEGCGLLVRYERFLGFISKHTTSGNDLSVESPIRDNSILFKDCTIKVEDVKQNKTNLDTTNEDKNDVKDIIKHNIYLSEIYQYTKQVAALKKIISRKETELEKAKEDHTRELETERNKLKREADHSNELSKKLLDTKKNFLNVITSFEQDAKVNINQLFILLENLNATELAEVNNKDHKKICKTFKSMLNSFIDNEDTQLKEDIDNLKTLFKSKGIY